MAKNPTKNTPTLPDEYYEAFGELQPPPDNIHDPHSQRMRDLSTALERARSHLPYKRAEYLYFIFNGFTPKKAAEKAGYVNPPAIRQNLRNPQSPEAIYMALLREVWMVNAGPTIEQRKFLLWDIAVQHKDAAPNASIKAVDVLNRMENLYGEAAAPVPTSTTNIYNNIDWEKVAEVKRIANEEQKALGNLLEHPPQDPQQS